MPKKTIKSIEPYKKTKVNYSGLFSLLREMNVKLYSLIRFAGINRYTIDCIKKGEPITMSAAEKICCALCCGIGDIIDFQQREE